jgi:hypothetical protein
MRRIRSVIAVACMALLLVAFAAVPAMAQGNNNNNGGNGTDRHLDRQDVRLDRQDVRLDRQLLNDNDDFFVFGAPLFFSHSFGFDNSCPFWGDNVGIVNQWDCLH